jgi:hypothetical protein
MLRVLAVLMLAGCATVPPTQEPIPLPPSSPAADLDRLWDAEVDDAVAGFTAIRPRLTTVESAVLQLFDAQLKGLEALAGPPSLPAVNAKTALLGGKGSESAIARLAADKARLDARTTELEGKADLAEKARIAAQARADAAAEQAIRAEAASNLSRVATCAIAAGIAAFLFGAYLGIPRWAAAATVGLGVLVATTAPQLLAFFGSDRAQHIMAATFAVLALGAVVSLALWAYRRLFPAKPCDDHGNPPPPQA